MIEVEYIQHMGDAKMVVNSARVSFGGDNDKPLSDRDEKLIKFLADHKHMCYSEDTEIFTEKGWIPFKDLTADTKVAAVSKNGETFKFEVPSNIYINKYKGIMYNINSSKVSFCVTPNHRMFFQQRTSSGFKDFEVDEIQNIFNKNIRFKSNAKLEGFGSVEDFYKGCLFGFYLGDGFLSSTNYVGFRLKKERKIKFLEDVLMNLNLDFKKKSINNGVFEIKINSNLFSDFDLKRKSKNKKIPEHLFKQSISLLDGIFTGLLNSDGSKKNRGYEEFSFSSTSTELLEGFERLATIIGKFPIRNKYNKVNVINKENPRVNDSRLDNDNYIKPIQYNGNIYCATVSTGLLLVRKNGKQLISGNSPFEHCQLTVKVKCPLYIRSQIHRHRTFSYNEISRRYTDKDMSFYIPEYYRKQSDVNKQCSYGALPDHENALLRERVEEHYRTSIEMYQEMIAMGVAKEQARGVLPQDLETEFYMSGNLRNFIHFISLRLHDEAQYEVQTIAKDTGLILLDKFGTAAKVLMDSNGLYEKVIQTEN